MAPQQEPTTLETDPQIALARIPAPNGWIVDESGLAVPLSATGISDAELAAGRRRRAVKAGILAGLAGMGAAGGALADTDDGAPGIADAVDDESAGQADPDAIIWTLQANSRSSELYDALHGTRDFHLSLSLPRQGIDIAYERNRTGSFEGGTDFLTVGAAFQAGAWTLYPGIRAAFYDMTGAPRGADDGFVEAALVAKRSWHDGRNSLRLLAVHDDTDFSVLRAYADIGSWCVSLGMKGSDWLERAGGPHADWNLGYGNERAGAFIGQSVTKDWTMNGYLNTGGISAFYAQKEFHDIDKRWAYLLAGTRRAGAEPTGMFTPGTGRFVIEADTDTVIHPFLGPFDSYLRSTGSDASMELVSFENEGLRILQASFGRKLLETEGGIELYAGLSAQERKELAHNGIRTESVEVGVDASLVVPITFGGTLVTPATLTLDYHHMPNPMVDNQLVLGIQHRF